MPVSWVVFHPNQPGLPLEANSVCTHAQWERLEQIRPGSTTLIQSGLPSEAAAEMPRRRLVEPTEPALGKV
jgi:hypothetical protein